MIYKLSIYLIPFIFYLLILLFISFVANAQLVSSNNELENKNDILLQRIEKNELENKNDILLQRIENLEKQVIDLQKSQENTENKIAEFSELSIKGFFDVSISNYKNKPNIFSLGNFELDIERSYKNNFQVAAALVFDEEYGTYLGVGFIDYSLDGDPVNPRGRLFVKDGLHVQIGKFDVPLGNDWRHVSSVSRITVTSPLTTTYLMEEEKGVYNDVGVRILFNHTFFNFSFYTTHGVDNKQTFGGNTFGFRLGVTPFNNPYTFKADEIPVFEVGISYLYDINGEGEEAEQIVVIDYESETEYFLMRGEYYYRTKTAGVSLNGYHITSGYKAEILSTPIIFFLRYGQYEERNVSSISYTDTNSNEESNVEFLARVTAGTHFNISDISYLKLEYQNYIKSSKNFENDEYFINRLYYIQLVIQF